LKESNPDDKAHINTDNNNSNSNDDNDQVMVALINEKKYNFDKNSLISLGNVHD
jgi:hypothetical protein